MTADVGVAGGQPPVTEGVGERTAFANKAVTNGGAFHCRPRLSALKCCPVKEAEEGEGPHLPPCAGRAGCGDWPGCTLP